jgi:hypothetical protein
MQLRTAVVLFAVIGDHHATKHLPYDEPGMKTFFLQV